MKRLRETLENTSWQVWIIDRSGDKHKLQDIPIELPVMVFNPGTETEFEKAILHEEDAKKVFEEAYVICMDPFISYFNSTHSHIRLAEKHPRKNWHWVAEAFCTSHESLAPLKQ